jgi:heptose-I-phosphate ethanolaminephosphotransferase
MGFKAVRRKYILRALLESILVIGLVYAFYALFGMNNVMSLKYGVRNLVFGAAALFLAQIFTGRLLTHPCWLAGLVLFFITQAVYSWMLIQSAGEAGFSLDLFRGYYLGYLASAVLLFFFAFWGSQNKRLRPVVSVLSFVLLAFFYLALVVFILYYVQYRTAFTSADMIAALETSPRETKEFLESHFSLGQGIAVVAAVLALLALCAWFVKHGYEEAGHFEVYQSSLFKLGEAIIVIAALITAGHWLAKIYPYRDYYIARSYIENERDAERRHGKNVKELTVDASHKTKGTIVLVIGESETSDHMKAFTPDYPVDTTPWLTKEAGDPCFYIFPHAYTNYTKTAEAMAMFATGVNQYNDQKPKNTVTIGDVARKAGYHTYWISNHTPSTVNVAVTVLAENSDHNWWVHPPAVDDMNVMEFLKQVKPDEDNFVVINIQGSHDKYKFRYPADFPEIQVPGHSDKVNEYDTSVAYTDKVLEAIYEYARDHLNLQAMVYCSDHGEDMQYFHGASKFTWEMDHVPFFTYLSPSYMESHPETAANLRSHINSVFTNDLMFDLLCGIMNVPNPHYEVRYDISSRDYCLTADNALTMHGKRKIADDPAL